MTLKDVVLYGILFTVIVAPQAIYGEIQTSSGGLTPLVYIIGFIAISFTAMSYMRMSKRFPIAGSVYSYVQRGLNPHAGFIAGWLILLDYLFIPSLCLVLVANWGTALVPGSPWYLWIIVFVIFNTTVNIRGISLQKGVDWVLFVVEIVAVIAFIALGTFFILKGGGTGHFSTTPLYQPGKVNIHFIATAISIAALSFLGFDGMSTLAEETVKPEKNIGKGIIIVLFIMVTVFVLQTYMAALIQPDLSKVDPQMGFFNTALTVGGPILYKGLLIVNIVAVGIANNMNAQTASSRLLYSMGRDGVIPRIFGKVHPRFHTPYIASIALAIVSLLLPLFLDMPTLVSFVNFGALSSFMLLNFAVFRFFFIKEKKRFTFGSYIKYLICPWAGILILLYVFSGFAPETFVVGISWLVIGIVIGAIKSKGYKNVPEAFKHLEV